MVVQKSKIDAYLRKLVETGAFGNYQSLIQIKKSLLDKTLLDKKKTIHNAEFQYGDYWKRATNNS